MSRFHCWPAGIAGYVKRARLESSCQNTRIMYKSAMRLARVGRLDQGLVGNAESTHVDRPKAEAPFVLNFGRYCNMLRILILD